MERMSDNRNVVGHFIFSFFVFLFFFFNLFYSIRHELARVPCFSRFFFSFLFFFSIHFKLSFCRPLLRRRERIRFERSTGCAHIYIYIYIFDRSVHAVYYTRIDDGDDDPVFLINSLIDAPVRSPWIKGCSSFNVAAKIDGKKGEGEGRTRVLEIFDRFLNRDRGKGNYIVAWK